MLTVAATTSAATGDAAAAATSGAAATSAAAAGVAATGAAAATVAATGAVAKSPAIVGAVAATAATTNHEVALTQGGTIAAWDLNRIAPREEIPEPVFGGLQPHGKDSPWELQHFYEGLPLELHLHETTLQSVHSAARTSLAELLLLVLRDLRQAAGIGGQEIRMLGIHGVYQSDDASSNSRKDEEVVVRFAVLPRGGSQLFPEQVVGALNARLNSPSSALRASPFAYALRNATIVVGQPRATEVAAQRKQEDIVRLGAMALPIAISAAFTGLLIWLAAW